MASKRTVNMEVQLDNIPTGAKWHMIWALFRSICGDEISFNIKGQGTYNGDSDAAAKDGEGTR